jgi:hypothetical protein
MTTQRTRNGLVILVLFLSYKSLLMGAEVVSFQTSEGHEICAVAAGFWAALSEGDGATAKSLFDGPPEHAQVIDSFLQWVAASKRLTAAMPAGLERRSASDMFDAPVIFKGHWRALAQTPIVINGDRAWIGGTSMLNHGVRLIRKEGTWRINALAPTVGEAKALDQQVRVLARQADKLAEQFKNETFPKGDPAAWHDDEFGKALLAATLATTFDESRAEGDIVAAPGTQPFNNATSLQQSIGQELQSDGLRQLIGKLPGLPMLAFTTDNAFVTSHEWGMSYSLQGRTFLVRLIAIYGEDVEGFHAYRGELPLGISIDDVRQDIESKLGSPPESSGGGATPYCAEYKQIGIIIDYRGNDPHDAKNRIARITLLKPDPTADPSPGPPGAVAKTRLAFRLVADRAAPNDPGIEMLDNPDRPNNNEKLAVERAVAITQDMIESVKTTQTEDHKPAVTLKMTSGGADWLQKVSSEHAGRNLAIVLDGKVLTAPRMNGVLRDQVIITPGRDEDPRQMYRIEGKLHAVINALAAASTTQPAPNK